MQADAGDILLGKYRVEDVIGVGGMGRVVRATHLYLEQPVAIKILLQTAVEHQQTVERFLREAQATVKLRNEHIARVMDVGTMPDGAPFIVMEYLEGSDLNQILRKRGSQQPQVVVDLMLQACEGLSEAHAIGIVHRDIKPSNFFITRRPDGSNLLKILDFGISKTNLGVSELTSTQTVVGTPTYMAPEQMRTARSTDPRSDIWSMGVVMYQMLAGRPPFEAETYAELVLKVGTEPPSPLGAPLPPGLESIVLRCLEKDPGRRIQNVGELARMLAPYASDPLSAQQAADRTARILTQPRERMSAAELGPGGVDLTPQHTPHPHTPPSWNQSSLGGASGQVGASGSSRGTRLAVIGGVAALCVATGLVGFFVARKSSSAAPASSSAPSAPAIAPAAAPPAPAQAASGSATTNAITSAAPAKPPMPTPAPSGSAAALATAATAPAATGSAAPAATSKPAVATTPKPAVATAKPTVAATKPTVAATKPKPATTKKPKPKPSSGGDLFDDRH